jgi:hypothetical protein
VQNPPQKNQNRMPSTSMSRRRRSFKAGSSDGPRSGRPCVGFMSF